MQGQRVARGRLALASPLSLGWQDVEVCEELETSGGPSWGSRKHFWKAFLEADLALWRKSSNCPGARAKVPGSPSSLLILLALEVSMTPHAHPRYSKTQRVVVGVALMNSGM